MSLLGLTRRRFLTAGAAAGCGWPFLFAQEEKNARPKSREPDEADFNSWITPETVQATNRGLQALVRGQKANGSINERQGGIDGVSTAITALSGLALMAGGHQYGQGEYGATLARALTYVLNSESRQTPGYLGGNDNRQAGMYSHGFALLYLCESFGMISNPKLSARLGETNRRAIKLVEKSQNGDGGWRYSPSPVDADISVTICQIMALRAARNAGFAVNRDVVTKCVKYVKLCQSRDGGFCYHIGSGETQFARSAAGVVALYSAGIYSGVEVEKGLEYLKRNRPRGGGGGGALHYMYGHYYAAQAMWTAGYDFFNDWFPTIRDELLARVRNRNDGLWNDPFGSYYGTAMACIILQTPLNYLPIFQK